MKKIINLIFDWCGTCSDDLRSHVYLAAMYVFSMLGLKGLTLEKFKEEFMAPYMDFYRKFTQESKTRIDELYLEKIRSLGRPKLFPGVKELLGFLFEKGKKLAILSSYPQETLLEETKHHGIKELFLDIVGSAHDKASAMATLMERNGFLPEETAYIGDMIYDIEVGKIARVTTIALSWGYQSKSKLLSAQPDFVLSNLREINKIIS